MTDRIGWWGDYELPVGGQSYWRLGALEFLVSRVETEWTITSTLGTEVLDETQLYEPTSTRHLTGTVLRVVGATAAALRLTPRLLDRTVVSRPVAPVVILPGTSVGIFMSTPTEIALSAGDLALTTLSSATMRRTWIGASTREGELGFSTRTNARLDLSNLSVHPTRAVTHVRIHNHGPEALRLERVNLPVRQLALYASAEGRLWTAEVRLQVQGGKVGEAQIETRPPEIAGPATELAPAQEVIDRGVMRRVLGALFT